MARKPARLASRAWLALIAPITCSGDSAARAARKRAPAEALDMPDSWARGSRGAGNVSPCYRLINLDPANQYVPGPRLDSRYRGLPPAGHQPGHAVRLCQPGTAGIPPRPRPPQPGVRSEERRVGKGGEG